MNTSNDRPVVLITGASSGIGAAAAQEFADAGYHVILAARRVDRLEELAKTISTRYPAQKFVALGCDVCSDVSVQTLFQQIEREFGLLNVLVNNAGYGVYGSVEETTVQQFQDNMETNYIGVIRCTQYALPLLRKAAAASKARWGASIVMISSIVGRRSIPLISSYSATKFAMEALSEALRVELSEERIAVSVVNPGATRTDFGEAAKGNRPGTFLSLEQGMPVEKVARVIVRVAKSPRRNSYLTIAGKACVFLQWLSPRILDWGFLRTWKKGKADATRRVVE